MPTGCAPREVTVSTIRIASRMSRRDLSSSIGFRMHHRGHRCLGILEGLPYPFHIERLSPLRLHADGLASPSLHQLRQPLAEETIDADHHLFSILDQIGDARLHAG